MPYEFYKVLHIVGILMVFASFGGLITYYRNFEQKKFPGRSLLMLTHGIGMTLIFVAGFGLMAKLAVFDWPAWILLKLLIWVILAVYPAFIFRLRQYATVFWWTAIGFGGTAALLAITKFG